MLITHRFALLGMDMSLADYDGRTALHLASAEGHVGVVKFLLEKCKVSPHVVDRYVYILLSCQPRVTVTSCVVYSYKGLIIDISLVY